jgi:hypothetical protein
MEEQKFSVNVLGNATVVQKRERNNMLSISMSWFTEPELTISNTDTRSVPKVMRMI